jgi:hypothetical protein
MAYMAIAWWDSMTSKSTWKQLERRIAATFGTERTPLSGSNSKMTASDTLDEKFFIEVKLRANVPFYTTFLKAQKQARLENKTPIVIFHKKGSMQNIVMLELKDFVNIEEIPKR